jgi:hypothetical protein
MKKEKTILIRLEEEQHNQYKELCKKHGLNMSQRFRNFIIEEIKNLKDAKKIK